MANEILNRIELLKQARIEINNEELEKQQKAETKKAELKKCIYELKDEIRDLIELANEVEKQGFSLTSEYGSKRPNFIAESITHQIGFCCAKEHRRNKEFLTYIGFNGGGCCGKWHFRTDGDRIAEISSNEDVSFDIKLDHLETFVERYPIFKENFLKYVDALIKGGKNDNIK